MYTLTLNDGTKIEGLALDGNILVSAAAITSGDLAGKLNPVTIAGTKDENDSEDICGFVGTHDHMRVNYIREKNGVYRIALDDIPADVWKLEQLEANQEYIAMMTGVTL